MATKSKLTILIVDDDKFIRDSLSDIFQKEGYSVKAAKSAAMIESFIQEGMINVAVIDYHMEGRTGVEIAEELKKKMPEIPAIMITGDESIALERYVREKGVFAYFVKPLELEMLKKTVAAACKMTLKKAD